MYTNKGVYSKNVREYNRFLLFLLQQRIAKKAARKRNVFCMFYFSKKKRKPAKEKYREMLSYQFVAHLPKLGKSEQK